MAHLFRLCGRLTLLALPLWLVSSVARADNPLFAFVDAAGVVHITDRIGDVPEPYYSVYRAREAERQRMRERAAKVVENPSVANAAPEGEDRIAGTSPGALPPAAGAEAQSAARKQWQSLMASWRKELVDSAAALHEAEQEAQGASNPILKETPQGRARYQQAQSNLSDARAKAVAAREMVVKVLPERAKQEHVPPQWLAF